MEAGAFLPEKNRRPHFLTYQKKKKQQNRTDDNQSGRGCNEIKKSFQHSESRIRGVKAGSDPDKQLILSNLISLKGSNKGLGATF